MSECTALMRVTTRHSATAAGVVALRRRIFERALDDAAVTPRVWLEALEPRRMMSGGGGAVAPFGGSWFTPFDVEVGTAGKIYAVGLVDSGSGLERFNADGTPDRSFGPDGTGTLTFDRDAGLVPEVVLPGADGGCVVTSLASEGVKVERFGADGSIDPSYGGGGGNGAALVTLHGVTSDQPPPTPSGADFDSSWQGFWAARTSDGGVSVAWMAGDALVEARLTADGRANVAFAPNGIRETPFQMPADHYATFVASVVHGADGGVTAYLECDSLAGGAALVRVAVGADGQLTSQSTALEVAQFGYAFWAVPVGADGSVIVGGPSGQVWHLDANGAVEGDVAVLSALAGERVFPQAQLADGRVTINFGIGGSEFLVLRADGSVDPTFNGGQPVDLVYGGWPLGLGDGSMIYVPPAPWAIERINPDGSVVDLSTPLPDGQPGPGPTGVGEVTDGSGADVVGDKGTPTNVVLPDLGDAGVDAAGWSSFDGLFAMPDGATAWDPSGAPAVYA